MAQAKLILMTIGLTVLIWVSADQLLRESDELLVNIRPEAVGAPSMSVAPTASRLAPFRVKVSGPRKLIAKKIASGPLTIDLPITERETGRYMLELEKELQRVPGVLEGLSIENVEPDKLEVIVDHEVTVSMPVRVDPGTLDFALKPTVKPSDVRVIISEIALRGLAPDIPGISQERQHLTLYVERYLSDFPEGELFSRDVGLDARVGTTDVKAEPAEVRLVAKLRERLKEATISAVPINFRASQAVFNRYLIDRRDNFTLLTQPITIKGSEDVVDRIVSGETKVFGVVFLTTPHADEVGTFHHVTPTFILPAGVELVEQPASIEFRLVPRKSTGVAEADGRAPS